ncbi:MAG: hypothetical protein WBD99_08325 [Thermodesulfobacteriota bacterium]
MITKKTVLVLGAGASRHLGFPTGTELKDQILNYDADKIKQSVHSDPVWGYVLSKFSYETYSKFFNGLKKSGRQAVDAFLEHRDELIDLGKALIARILISCEREEVLFETKNNWYQYFYNKLNAKFEDFSNNNVSVITFNYDRSLEQYLLTAIQNDYGKTEQEAADVVKSIPIIHLHGNLGDLPSLAERNARQYTQNCTPEILQLCIDSIKIIHQRIEADPQFLQADRQLSEAEIVCFLGFGYDKINLDRLKVNRIFKGDPKIFCSSFGLSDSERMYISNYIKGNTIIDYGYNEGNDVISFLRKHSPFD